MSRILTVSAVLALGLLACGGGRAVEDGPALVEVLAGDGIDCEGAGFASDDGETGTSSFTDVQPMDVGGCTAMDESLSLQVFPEDQMEQVRSDAEAAAVDEQDSLAVGGNWVVLGDPPEVERVAQATGADYLE